MFLFVLAVVFLSTRFVVLVCAPEDETRSACLGERWQRRVPLMLLFFGQSQSCSMPRFARVVELRNRDPVAPDFDSGVVSGSRHPKKT